MDRKVILDQGRDAGGGLQNPALRFGAVGAALAVDRQPLPLPINILFPKPGQFCHSEAGVEQGSGHQLFLVCLAGIG